MLHACVRKFDVTDTAQTFLGTKRSFCSHLHFPALFLLLTLIRVSDAVETKFRPYLDLKIQNVNFL